MFYSQTYLGRKGPLGTVWCAAHLQHRLKKSHYTSTDIPKTVDYIMYSEVPIALRMSGHLLLGVVRIYSKKVEYLFKDCNVVLTGLSKLFASSMDLNLPENARQAPVQAVTLPQTFELDALDLDDPHQHDSEDSNVSSREDITLPDQIPNVLEPFIAITFDEAFISEKKVLTLQDTFGTPQSKARENSGVRSTEEGYRGVNIGDEENVPPLGDLGPSQQSEAQDASALGGEPTGATHEASPMDFVPEFEAMRDADSELRRASPLNVPFHLDDTREEIRGTEPVMNEETPRSIIKEVATPRSASPLDQQHSGQQSSGSVHGAPENFDAGNSFGVDFVINPSPQLEIQPSPQAEQPPPPKRRKRKQFFDEAVVLTNRSMRKALHDTNDILRKRKPNSCLLDLWKLNKRLRKEQIFDHPLITGLSEDLVSLSDKDYMYSKASSIPPVEIPQDPMATEDQTAPIAEESFPDQTVADSSNADQNLDLEIERLRDREESGTGTVPFDEFLSSPVAEPSSSKRSEYTPFLDHGTNILSEIPESTTIGSTDQSLPDLSMSTGPFGSDLDTPVTLSGGDFGFPENCLFDIPELDTAEEELNFLEADNPSPSGSWGSQGGDSLSVRTRAVAQYLQRQSPIAPTAEGETENLSLNKILGGKRRSLCARMFYETLVLKSYGIVDAQQEEPYGDISLKLDPTSSKAQL